MKAWRSRNSLGLWLTWGKAATDETSLSSDLPGVRTPTGLTWVWRKGATHLRPSWPQTQKQPWQECSCQQVLSIELPPCLAWPHTALRSPQSQSLIISTLPAPLFTRADTLPCPGAPPVTPSAPTQPTPWSGHDGSAKESKPLSGTRSLNLVQSLSSKCKLSF